MNFMDILKSEGCDTEKLKERFSGSEALIAKFYKKFPADASFAALGDAVERGDNEAAFGSAHTLKGIAGNLEMTKLFGRCRELTEYLRGGGTDRERILAGFAAIKSEYEDVCGTIEIIEERRLW